MAPEGDAAEAAAGRESRGGRSSSPLAGAFEISKKKLVFFSSLVPLDEPDAQLSPPFRLSSFFFLPPSFFFFLSFVTHQVIVQVEEVLPASAPRLPARQVAIPGHLVDAVVVVSSTAAAESPLSSSTSPTSSSSLSPRRRRREQQHRKQHAHHEQVIGVPEFERSLCGGEGGGEAVPRPIASPSSPAAAAAAAARPLPRGARRVVANRALLELLSSPFSPSGSRPLLVNVGVGMPEGVAALLGDAEATAALLLPATAAPSALVVPPPPPRLTLSTEAGALGGTPAGGRAFGASHNAAAHVPLPTMLDMYQGGAVAVAVLGESLLAFRFPFFPRSEKKSLGVSFSCSYPSRCACSACACSARACSACACSACACSACACPLLFPSPRWKLTRSLPPPDESRPSPFFLPPPYKPI